MIRFGTNTKGVDSLYDGVTYPAPHIGPVRKHGKIELMMNGYIYLYIPWTVIQDTGIWRENCTVVLKTGIP